MRVVGIVAEYNPLHNGHIYHMEEARRLTGADYVIVALSGNFVQRGEPACTDKYTRTEWALQAGADLVIEIPCVFTQASAERYAAGAVRLLSATGIVTDLAFGCELDDLGALRQLAKLLNDEPQEFKLALARHLRMGKSYPQARFDALFEYGVPHDLLMELKKPNNILAVEYLRAIERYAPKMNPVPVRRIGNDYNNPVLTGELSSATAIRTALREGDRDVLTAMPMFVSGAMQFDEQFPITANDIGAMLLYKLRGMSLEDIRRLPDVSEGFETNLARAARTCCDADSFFEAVKTRRFTMARVKRISMCALLDISADLAEDMQQDVNLYLRVLGRRRITTALLSALRNLSPTPLILRNSDYAALTETAQASLRADMLSTDILCYALRREFRRDTAAAILMEG